MATTPIYAGGSRRSAAPAYTPMATPGTAAVGYDEELIRQIVGNMAPVASGSSTAAPSLAEIFGSGTNVMDFGGNSDGTSATGPATDGVSPGTVGAIGTGLSALGTLGENSSMSSIGGMMGLAGAMGNATSNSEAIGIMGQAALGMMGVPGVGLASNAISGNVPGMMDAALGIVSAPLAAANALLGLVTGKTIGQMISGAVGESPSSLTSDAENATGIVGFGLSDANKGDAPSGAAPAEGFGFGTTGSDTGTDGTDGGDAASTGDY